VSVSNLEVEPSLTAGTLVLSETRMPMSLPVPELEVSLLPPLEVLPPLLLDPRPTARDLLLVPPPVLQGLPTRPLLPLSLLPPWLFLLPTPQSLPSRLLTLVSPLLPLLVPQGALVMAQLPLPRPPRKRLPHCQKSSDFPLARPPPPVLKPR
jgi:hypothetical protein